MQVQDEGKSNAAFWYEEYQSALRRERGLTKALYLIAHVEEGCGGRLSPTEYLNSAVNTATDALERHALDTFQGEKREQVYPLGKRWQAIFKRGD